MKKAKMTAEDGFFLAKAQVKETLDGRINLLTRKKGELTSQGKFVDAAFLGVEIEILFKISTHFRNSLLWDTDNN
jgi:hypothetical protein